MEHLLQSWDPLTIAVILFPLGLIGAAFALRMACAICSEKVPDFVPAAIVVVVALTANLVLRIALNHNDMTLGTGSQLLLTLLTSALIISFSVRTSIASALAITVTQVFLCGIMYLGISEVSHAML